MLLNELLVDILKNLEIRFLNLVFINKSLLLSHGSFFLKNDILDKDKSVGKIFPIMGLHININCTCVIIIRILKVIS